MQTPPTNKLYIGRPVGIVTPNFENAAYRVLKKRIETSQGEAKAVLQNRLEKYRQSHMTVGATQARDRRLQYHTLGEFLKIDNIPVWEVFQEAGIELYWPSDEAYQLSQSLRELTIKQRNTLYRLVCILVPNFFATPTIGDPILRTPTKKMFYLLRNMPTVEDGAIPKLARSCSSETLRATLSNRKESVMADEAGILEVAKFLNVSPAWLFGFCELDIPLLAKTALEEKIIAGYLFLSDIQKKVVKEVAAIMTRGDCC